MWGLLILLQAVGYQECSGNKVRFYQANGLEFSGGVMELQINQNVAGLPAEYAEDYVTDKLSDNGFQPSRYTNVMYILPAEANFYDDAGYAYRNGYLSVISDVYASKQYVLMHEIAHNFGHHHSGQGTSPYGDDTCMMGIQTYADDAPRACFNGAKSWWFDWYSDRHIEVTPTSGSMRLNMLSINDYLNGEANSDDQYTVARIVGDDEIDLFIMYNRAEGVNSQVSGHRDQVTIVRQSGESQQSWFEAGLSEEEIWTKHNWNGSGNTLVIQVCNVVSGTPDYARVIVYLQGVNDLSCDTPDPQSGCQFGFSKFKAGVKTDSWGDEVGWWLKEKDENGRFGRKILRDRGMFSRKILGDNNLPSNEYSSKEICIDDSKCYKFKIRDEGGDGICCDHGRGWYNIKVEDEIIKHSTFEDLSNEATVFGSC